MPPRALRRHGAASLAMGKWAAQGFWSQELSAVQASSSCGGAGVLPYRSRLGDTGVCLPIIPSGCGATPSLNCCSVAGGLAAIA